MYQLAGTDLTQIHGIGPFLALRLIAECGTDLSRWPTAKHFTSWLTLSLGCKISGGKVLSAHTRKTSSRVTVDLRLAAVNVGKTNTARGAFYRRLAARIGKAKAVTATARKIAGLFYNAMRHGMEYRDPGADHYEQQYRDRVIKQQRRRAIRGSLAQQPVASRHHHFRSDRARLADRRRRFRVRRGERIRHGLSGARPSKRTILIASALDSVPGYGVESARLRQLPHHLHRLPRPRLGAAGVAAVEQPQLRLGLRLQR